MRDDMLDTGLKELALKLALHCVRNTIIEDYHARGSISDAEMKVFNKQVVNNLYTFLQLMHNPNYQAELETLFSETRIFHFPTGWNEPVLNQKLIDVLRTLRNENL